MHCLGGDQHEKRIALSRLAFDEAHRAIFDDIGGIIARAIFEFDALAAFVDGVIVVSHRAGKGIPKVPALRHRTDARRASVAGAQILTERGLPPVKQAVKAVRSLFLRAYLPRSAVLYPAAFSQTGNVFCSLEFFKVIARHSDAPAPPSSPLAWGDPAHVEQLLGKDFELKFEKGVSNAYHDSAEDIWSWYTRGFGPLRQLAEDLAPDRMEGLKRDIDAYHRHYAVPAGLHMKREYLLTMGRRR